ncbi:MAG: PAS domain S-box protein [Chloroflexi bacterium]|nr:PAS domain S-box protein [Chloroflexota bacterium]
MLHLHDSAGRNHDQATGTSVMDSAFRALHEVAVAISGVLDPASLARLVVERAHNLLGVDSASLLLWDPGTELLRLIVTDDPNATAYDPFRVAGQGIGGVAFQRCEPVVIEEYQRWEHASPRALACGVQSAAAVPLLVNHRALGALSVRSYTPRRFGPEQVQLLVLFAALAGPALEAARLHAQSEGQRAELAERYQAVACGVLVRDAAGSIVDANPAAEAILGFTLDQMRGRTPDALWPLAREDGSELPHEQRPGTAALRTGRPVQHCTIRITRPDGEHRWLLDDAVPVLGEQGAPAQVVSSFIDITALKRAEHQTRLVAEHLERLIEGTSDAIITMDLQGHVLSWNQGAEQMYGWSREDAVGRINPAVPTALADDRVLPVQRVLHTGQPVANYETERLTRDGRRIPVLGTLSPLRDEAGQIVALLGITKDLSAHKRLAEQARLLHLVEERERIAVDLHDGIIQSLYALGLRLGAVARKLDGNTAEARESLRQVEAQVHGIIQSIRNFIFDLRPHELDTCSLRTGLQTLAEEIRLNALLPVEVELDEGAEQQLDSKAVAHLLAITREATSNVLRHAGASMVWLRLARAEGQVALVIRDNGGGFDPQRRGRRVGEGLHNMAERAQALGGRLAIQSQPGQGTEIRVEVPVSARMVTA